MALIAVVAVNKAKAKDKAVRLGIFSLNNFGCGKNRAVITERKLETSQNRLMRNTRGVVRAMKIGRNRLGLATRAIVECLETATRVLQRKPYTTGRHLCALYDFRTAAEG